MTVLLPNLQAKLIAAVGGEAPDLPAEWFAGDPERAALGLSAHATTVRHARTEAMAATYPKTKVRLGRSFARYARAHIASKANARILLQEIGIGFADTLALRGEEDAAAIAAVEWALQESYCSAEAEPLNWDIVAAAEHPLKLRLMPHPAARVVTTNEAACECFGLAHEAATHILVTRPFADILLHPVNLVTANLFGALAERPSLDQAVNLLLESTGCSGDQALSAFSRLVEVGALSRAPCR